MRHAFPYVAVLSISCVLVRAQSPSAADQTDTLALEAKLATDPGNEELHASLMEAYAKAGDSVAYVQQLLWLIENRPESQILGPKGKLKPAGGPLNSASDYVQVKSAWEVQLEKHAESGAVAYNAAVFLTPSDPERAIDLLERARKTAPGQQDYVSAEGVAYLMAFATDDSGKALPPLTQEAADGLKVRLRQSSDPELLSGAGKVIATKAFEPDTKKMGIYLMERAVSLDPSNRKWKQALDSMQQPESSRNAMARAVRIGSSIAEANLIEKVEPAYPVLAKSGRVQGVVELTVLIDEDGTVQSAELVSGPPLLVSAAKDAVLQWRYNPTMLDGNPVGVVTNVSVTFTLSQ